MQQHSLSTTYITYYSGEQGLAQVQVEAFIYGIVQTTANRQHHPI